MSAYVYETPEERQFFDAHDRREHNLREHPTLLEAKAQFEKNARGKALQLLAEWLVSIHRCVTDPITGRLYVYDAIKGVYVTTGEELLKRDLVLALEELITKHGMNEVITKVRALSYRNLEELEASTPPHRIPLANGVYDLHAKSLLAHSPDYFFTYVHPVKYAPDAECPEIDRFLDEVVATKDEREILLDIAACCLYRGRVTRHFYILVGVGHNGKSIYLVIVQALLGRARCVAITPQALSKDTFAGAQLHDRHADLGGDIPNGRISDSSFIKNVTGGDPVSVQRKGVDRIDIIPYAELVYSSNDPPRITEDTYAIWDRLVPVKFPYTFVEHPTGPMEKQGIPKEKLLSMLLTPTELSGLLNKLLARIPTLVETGRLSVKVVPEDTRRLYRARTDSLAVWTEECTEEAEYVPGGPHGPAVGYERADAAYKHYQGWCKVHGIKSVSFRKFGKEIEQTHGFERGKELGGDVRSYRGLRIKQEAGQDGQIGRKIVYASPNYDSQLEGDYSESVLSVRSVLPERQQLLAMIRTQPEGIPIVDLGPSLRPIAEKCKQEGDLIENPAGVLRCP